MRGIAPSKLPRLFLWGVILHNWEYSFLPIQKKVAVSSELYWVFEEYPHAVRLHFSKAAESWWVQWMALLPLQFVMGYHTQKARHFYFKSHLFSPLLINLNNLISSFKPNENLKLQRCHFHRCQLQEKFNIEIQPKHTKN